MRSVADELREQDRWDAARLTPGERVAAALGLGARDLETYRRAQRPPLDREEAARRLARRRQAGRRRSGAIEALLG